jgi:hypothetical protein
MGVSGLVFVLLFEFVIPDAPSAAMMGIALFCESILTTWLWIPGSRLSRPE